MIFTEVSAGPNHALIARNGERYLALGPECPQDEADQAWNATFAGHKVLSIETGPVLDGFPDWLGVFVNVAPEVTEVEE